MLGKCLNLIMIFNILGFLTKGLRELFRRCLVSFKSHYGFGLSYHFLSLALVVYLKTITLKEVRILLPTYLTL